MICRHETTSVWSGGPRPSASSSLVTTSRGARTRKYNVVCWPPAHSTHTVPATGRSCLLHSTVRCNRTDLKELNTVICCTEGQTPVSQFAAVLISRDRRLLKYSRSRDQWLSGEQCWEEDPWFEVDWPPLKTPGYYLSRIIPSYNFYQNLPSYRGSGIVEFSCYLVSM